MECSNPCKGMYSRHLKAVVAALLLLCMVTLLLYSSPPTSLIQSSVSLLRLDVFETSTSRTDTSPPLKEAVPTPACTPQNHIMYLKTHKCASTTVQNIFLRYGYTRNLMFALKSEHLTNQFNYLGNPSKFKASLIPRHLLPPSGKVDIFALHTRLDISEHTKVLHNDTFWVTVVRDPVDLFESLYNYFHLQNFYMSSLEDFVKSPLKSLLHHPRYLNKFGHNQMMFDMGYEANLDVIELRSAIEELDSKFHLVLISELLEESLILLRHKLCWSLDDVIFFTKNARRKEFKPQLSNATQHRIREINSADALLYDYFLAKHKAAVLEFGKDRMAKELNKLQSLRDDYFDDCSIHTFKGHDPHVDQEFQEYSAQVNAYVATNNNKDENCALLAMSELSFIKIITTRQKELLKEMTMLKDIENVLI
ncbi:unnamed protein product [Meganyctiphanes norvegica]|uniref:Galactosylceramide sulfotransferase n=1 Tax=Meganyctiphanes norvegica TaxID=48144 RepID=A0AAV2QLG0_MEGNR